MRNLKGIRTFIIGVITLLGGIGFFFSKSTEQIKSSSAMDLIRFMTRYFTETLSGVSIEALVLLVSMFLIFSGLGRLLLENLFIKVFKRDLINREQKLVNRNNVLEKNFDLIKTSFETASKEWKSEKNGYLSNIDNYKQRLELYEPKSKPTFQKLIIHNGEWEYGEDKNIASCQILSCKEGEYRPSSVYIDRPTINPLTQKPFEKHYEPVNTDMEMITYIISVSFKNPLLNPPSSVHKFRERLEDGSLGKPLLLKTTRVINGHNVQILYTTTKASGEFHLIFQ